MGRVLAALVVGLAVSPARGDEAVDRAVAHVRKLGGEVKRDEKRPGSPVVGINLAYKTVADDDLKALAPLADLADLDLEGTGVTSAGLKHLAPLKSLATLNLSATKLSPPGLKDLAALPKLADLNIYTCSHTEEGLKELAQVKTLTALVASSSPFDLNDAVLKEWTALKSLRSLKLHGPYITDEGLKSIAAMPDLTTLQVWFPRKTTPDGWKPIAGLTKLKALSLAGGNFPKEEGGNITDAVLKNLAPLAGLTELELDETGTTDAGLEWVGKFGKLTALRVVDSPAVTDAGVKRLAGLKDLTTLELTGSSVTDDGAEALAGFPKLTVLKVGRTKVTKEGAAGLRAALPKCEVTWFAR